MADCWMIREDMALRPFGREAAEQFSKLPSGKPVYVEIRQPRNGKFHRLYWCLCARIASAVGCEGEDISCILKKRTGYVKEIKTKRGIEEVPLSISFAKMDNIAFRDFFEKCLVVIETEIEIALPDLRAELKDLLDTEKAA